MLLMLIRLWKQINAQTSTMIILLGVLLFCAHGTRGIDIECDPNRPLAVNLSQYPSGNIFSPGFSKGQDYPTEIQCQVSLRSPSGTYIHVKINTIDIEISDACKTDFLAFIEFSNRNVQRVKGKFCGDNPIADIISDSQYMILVFKSDYMRTAKGFNVTYDISLTQSLCQLGKFQCRNRKCISNIGARLCNGQDDCGDGTDEEDCGFPVAPSPKCGSPDVAPVLSGNLVDRIVGGREALQGSWPWQVDMQAAMLEPNGHFCGGTLINAQWFVTAAHCFNQIKIPQQIRIHLGNHHKFKRDQYEEIRFAKDYFIYGVTKRDFIRDGNYLEEHDIALVKLNAPVVFNPHIQPACLPLPNEELQIKKQCFATGWGESRGSSSSDALKQAEHPVQNETACKQPYYEINNKTMICAGRLDALNGLCHGDSGGPLVCRKADDRWYLYGAASFVTEGNMLGGICGLENKPTVFTKVSSKISYINSILSNNAI